jgi:hypothetical protein
LPGATTTQTLRVDSLFPVKSLVFGATPSTKKIPIIKILIKKKVQICLGENLRRYK